MSDTKKFVTAFIDEAKIYVKAGSGGNGCSSFYRDRRVRIGRPDGGYGGDGGDVIIESNDNIQTLLDFQYQQHQEAESGTHGSSNHKKGRRGNDLCIMVPPGTVIRDAANGMILRDLSKARERVRVANGGSGGRGNSRGREAEKGSAGEEKTLLLELKLIADAGVVGYPNAGKSTLISKISSAHPKIANYPFTTKEPALGVVKIYDGFNVVVADIPGLIEGAHKGRGLGHRFLRHIERTKILIHMIDVSAFEGRDPYADYLSLNKELELYSKELADKPQIITLNKIDCPGAKANALKFKKHISGKKVFSISALTGEGLGELLKELHKKLKRLKAGPNHEKDSR